MVLPRGRGFFILPVPVPGGLFKFQARLCPGRLAAFLGAQGVEVAEPRAADAAHDVHEVGDIVMHEDDIVHLLAQIQRRHQQHTLHASTKKGNRPSYIHASKPDIAIPMYEAFCAEMGLQIGKEVQTGTFGADMKVELVNDGPVTIWIDSQNKE